MIGYSDSAKDAGVMAASWAQYCAQEALIKLCDKEKVKLTLFMVVVVPSVAVERKRIRHCFRNRLVV